VEDNVSNRRLVAAFLKRWGIEAELISSGREALQAIEHRRYDVILMDIQMPELDGFETTRLIRKWELEDRERPGHYIIALTAFAMSDDRDECLNAGMNDFVSKPIDPEALKQAFERAATAIGSGENHSKAATRAQN